MPIRAAAWLVLLGLAMPVCAQTTPADAPQPSPPEAPRDEVQPAENPAKVTGPDRFLPTEKIPPDSVISFPADI